MKNSFEIYRCSGVKHVLSVSNFSPPLFWLAVARYRSPYHHHRRLGTIFMAFSALLDYKKSSENFHLKTQFQYLQLSFIRVHIRSLSLFHTLTQSLLHISHTHSLLVDISVLLSFTTLTCSLDDTRWNLLDI